MGRKQRRKDGSNPVSLTKILKERQRREAYSEMNLLLRGRELLEVCKKQGVLVLAKESKHFYTNKQAILLAVKEANKQDAQFSVLPNAKGGQFIVAVMR